MNYNQGNTMKARVFLFLLGLAFFFPLTGIPKVFWEGFLNITWSGNALSKGFFIVAKASSLIVMALCIYMALVAED